MESWYVEDGVSRNIRKGSFGWWSAKEGKHQSSLHLCCMLRGIQEAKQVYHFSPMDKPKDQVIKQLTHRLSWHLGHVQIDYALFPSTWTLSSVSEWVSSVLFKTILYKGCQGGSAVKSTVTSLEDMGSIPNIHIVASQSSVTLVLDYPRFSSGFHGHCKNVMCSHTCR